MDTTALLGLPCRLSNPLPTSPPAPQRTSKKGPVGLPDLSSSSQPGADPCPPNSLGLGGGGNGAQLGSRQEEEGSRAWPAWCWPNCLEEEREKGWGEASSDTQLTLLPDQPDDTEGGRKGGKIVPEPSGPEGPSLGLDPTAVEQPAVELRKLNSPSARVNRL